MEHGRRAEHSVCYYVVKLGGTNKGANNIATGMVNAHISSYLFWKRFVMQPAQSDPNLFDATDGLNQIPSASSDVRHAVETGPIISAFQDTDNSVLVVFTNSGTSS